MSLPVVVLSREGVARLRSGHPWIYEDQLVARGPEAPCLVALQGPVDVPRGHAVWNPRSKIALRVVSNDAAVTLAPDFWRARLDAAIVERVERLAPGEGACRWVHAEADGLPGLIVDRYGEIAVVQAGCGWADALAPELARHLVDAHGLVGVLARHDGGFRRPEGLAEGIVELAGRVPHEVSFTIGGLRRTCDPWTGQKTGAYLDQREAQPWAARVLPEGRALDAFCCDGGFSLQLARAGREVLALDSSEPALHALTQLAQLNGLAGRITPRKANVFHELKALGEAGESFDGIVLDPPALAKRRADRESARRAYKDLNLRALRLLRPGGRLVTCSCSFHVSAEEHLDVLRAAAADSGRDVRLLERRGAAGCHPARLTFPESSYLKVVLLEAR